jgi:hypothetical protein
MYLGNQPALAYTSLAKQDFTTSATTSYVLDNPVANENEIALFINFVRQEPTTAYTASGTSLTLTSATSASDDMYCVFLGKAVQTVNPPADSVGTSQITNGAVTSSKMFSGFANGITVVDQWRITANHTTSGIITSNWERVDNTGWGGIGTGMTESSGVFTFPSTGVYSIRFTCQGNGVDNDNINGYIEVTVNNADYNIVARANWSTTAGEFNASSTEFLFDVTNVTTHKARMIADSIDAGSAVSGNTSQNETFVTFVRLGDT